MTTFGKVRVFYRKRFTRTLKARGNRQILAIIVSKELMGLWNAVMPVQGTSFPLP
jgi:hypothetical protein